MKKILAINYSQTGQLDEIMDEFISSMTEFDIDRVKIEMINKFEFPWTAPSFFNVMPECVNEVPAEISPIIYKHKSYDLIILGYQPWFLSPSIPTISLLKNDDFKTVLNHTPIVTVIGARNMWLNSQISVVDLIEKAGGKIIGNLPLIDKASNLLSAASILHWMLNGKKERKWGILPLPGVSQQDIKSAASYGQLLKQHIIAGELNVFQQALVKAGGLIINTNILFIEGRAKTIFKAWASLILKKEAAGANRAFWLEFFKYYLIVALFIISPIVVLSYNVLIRPLTIRKIKAKKLQFSYLGIHNSIFNN